VTGGLEQKSVSPLHDNNLQLSENQGGAKCGALFDKNGKKLDMTDPDLLRLVESWPTLPPALKNGILAMVRASQPVEKPKRRKK
jgi:hypothetical protein